MLIMGYDYLNKKDVQYFAGRLINPNDLKVSFKEMLVNNCVDLYALLIDEHDREICYNFSIKIHLANKGHISIDEVAEELKDFVMQYKKINLLNEDILAGEPDYEDIGNDLSGCFTGEEVMFKELTTSGKLAFLYLMPEYLKLCGTSGILEGTALWDDCFLEEFDILWNTVAFSDIFSDVLYME